MSQTLSGATLLLFALALMLYVCENEMEDDR